MWALELGEAFLFCLPEHNKYNQANKISQGLKTYVTLVCSTLFWNSKITLTCKRPTSKFPIKVWDFKRWLRDKLVNLPALIEKEMKAQRGWMACSRPTQSTHIGSWIVVTCCCSACPGVAVRMSALISALCNCKIFFFFLDNNASK